MIAAIQSFDFKGEPVRWLLDEGGEPWFVGKDVAAALGYTNPNEALIDHVDQEDRLNSKSLSAENQSQTAFIGNGKKLNNISLLSLGQRGGWLINESGLYSLILSSHLPKAREFKRWVTSEVLPTLRKTGVYTIQAKNTNSPATAERLKEWRLQIQEINANVRAAKSIQHFVTKGKIALTNESKQILLREVVRLCSGRDYPELLPDELEKLYSAGDIAAFLDSGYTNRDIMAIARVYDMIPPEGTVNEFGRWKMSKVPNSPRECTQWFFNARGFTHVHLHIAEEMAARLRRQRDGR